MTRDRVADPFPRGRLPDSSSTLHSIEELQTAIIGMRVVNNWFSNHLQAGGLVSQQLLTSDMCVCVLNCVSLACNGPIVSKCSVDTFKMNNDVYTISLRGRCFERGYIVLKSYHTPPPSLRNGR